IRSPRVITLQWWGWYDRHQDECLQRRACVQRQRPAEDCRRPVTRIVVQEWTTSAQLVLEIRKSRAGVLGPFIVTSAHAQRDAMSRRYHDRRRPELDIDRRDLARPQALRLIVHVIRPILGGEVQVELAVRRAQPALGDRRMRIDRAHEHHFPHVRSKYAQYEKEV